MELAFYILIALTSAALVWAVTRAVFSDKSDRRKLADRLSGDGKTYLNPNATKSIVIQGQADVSALSRALVTRSFFQSLAKQLNAAWPGTSLTRFLLLAAGIAAFAAFVTFAFTGSTFMACVAGLFLGYVPFMRVYGKVNKRHRVLAEQFPEGLDFLARILRSGHSLSTGLQMMGTELPEPLATEFRRCYDQHSLGQPLEDSLKDMANRIESTDFSFFVTAVLIQRQTGGDLSQVLTNISSMVRGRIRLASYVRAKTAEGRFTGYILVAFPMLMFFIAYFMNPDYAGKLLHTTTGQKLMATAVGLQVAGLVSIRKLTTVKV